MINPNEKEIRDNLCEYIENEESEWMVIQNSLFEAFCIECLCMFKHLYASRRRLHVLVCVRQNYIIWQR